jgi:hypothetical protein
MPTNNGDTAIGNVLKAMTAQFDVIKHQQELIKRLVGDEELSEQEIGAWNAKYKDIMGSVHNYLNRADLKATMNKLICEVNNDNSN